MSTTLEFAQYVSEIASGAGVITCRKMFGEYGVYCNGKLIGLLCDESLYLKTSEALKKRHPDIRLEAPYSGAKPYFIIEDIENVEFVTELIKEVYSELPPVKAK